MVHHQQTAAKPFTGNKGSPGKFQILLGVFWLLLGFVVLIFLLLYKGRVELRWETATEQNTAGFNVYRSDEPDEGYVLVNAEQLIDSKGDHASGATYTFIDDQVDPGETYYYVLEEVELDGSHRRHLDEVFQYSVPRAPWSAAVTAFISALVGVWLVLWGIKEKRRR